MKKFAITLVMLFGFAGCEPPAPAPQQMAPAPGQQPSNSEQRIELTQDEVLEVYSEFQKKAVPLFLFLEKEKETEEFRFWGFAGRGPYRDWPKEVDTLRELFNDVQNLFPAENVADDAISDYALDFNYAKLPYESRISYGLTALALYGISAIPDTNGVVNKLEHERQRDIFIQCFQVEELPEKETVEVKLDVKQKPASESKLEITKVKPGSVKYIKKWYKMRDDKLIEKLGYSTGNEMIRKRKTADPQELELDPQKVMFTNEMQEVWLAVDAEVKKRADGRKFEYQEEPEQIIFPTGRGVYYVEVPILFWKMGDKKKTTLAFKVNIPEPES